MVHSLFGMFSQFSSEQQVLQAFSPPTPSAVQPWSAFHLYSSSTRRVCIFSANYSCNTLIAKLQCELPFMPRRVRRCCLKEAQLLKYFALISDPIEMFFVQCQQQGKTVNHHALSQHHTVLSFQDYVNQDKTTAFRTSAFFGAKLAVI